MKYNPNRHNRHFIRLRGYNYANIGAYFVTICLNWRIPKMQPYMGAITIKDAINRAPTTTKPKFDFPTFGVVENGVMVLNDSGKIVQKIWNEMPKYYSSVELGEFIVMPDHIHGIIEINNDANRRGAIYRVQPCVQQPRIQPPSCGTGGFAADKNPMFHNNLARIIRWFKGRITFECHKINCDFKWQRNYYEHIIRDEAGYARIAKYIRNNPILWGRKRLNDILPQI